MYDGKIHDVYFGFFAFHRQLSVLDGSLETLVENLNNSDHEFKIFNHFYRKNENIRHLLKRIVISIGLKN